MVGYTWDQSAIFLTRVALRVRDAANRQANSALAFMPGVFG